MEAPDLYQAQQGGYDSYVAGLAASLASNVKVGDNPPYTVADFVSFYPQFGSVDQDGVYNGPAPVGVINAYIILASASLQYERWQEMWVVGMGLYVAHFLTLYLQASG